MKTKVIIITGWCASGKSTFADRLAEAINIPCISKDRFKESMADGFIDDKKTLQQRGSKAAMGVFLHIAECLIKTDTMCILESAFTAQQIEKVKVLTEKYNAECLTFQFVGDVDVLVGRYWDRQQKIHWSHQFDEMATDKIAFKQQYIKGHVNSCRGEAVFGQTIRVDTTDYNTVDYEALIKQAKNFVGAV